MLSDSIGHRLGRFCEDFRSHLPPKPTDAVNVVHYPTHCRWAPTTYGRATRHDMVSNLAYSRTMVSVDVRRNRCIFLGLHTAASNLRTHRRRRPALRRRLWSAAPRPGSTTTSSSGSPNRPPTSASAPSAHQDRQVVGEFEGADHLTFADDPAGIGPSTEGALGHREHFDWLIHSGEESRSDR
jgi:hypothetical protein